MVKRKGINIMKKFEIAPSILAADFTKLGEDVAKCEENGIKWLHIDVMDGIFVPNISFGTVVYEGLRKKSNMIFDVHLMITEPERYIERFIKSGADSITFHIEATKQPEKCIEIIKANNKRAAVSICPDTPVSAIKDLIDKLDMVLVMSVHPGYGGQSYIESVNAKISELRELCGENFDIQVDGGICKDNIADVIKLGANILVAGTAVFRGDIGSNIKELEEAACAL